MEESATAKVYCCSNTARSEAKKLALFDVVLSVLGLGFASWLTEVVRHHGEYFRNITEGTNTTLHDLKFLSDVSSGEANVWLGGFLVWEGWGIVLGGTLFYAALKGLVGLLRVWLMVGGVFVLVVELVVVVAYVVVAERKVVAGVNGSVLVLYRVYEVFIVKKMLEEFGSGPCCDINNSDSHPSSSGDDTGGGGGGDNNPTIVVVQGDADGGGGGDAG